MDVSGTDCGIRTGTSNRVRVGFLFTEYVFLDGVLHADITAGRVLLSEAVERRPIVLHVEGEVALTVLGHVEGLVLLLLLGEALGISLHDCSSHEGIHCLLVHRRTIAEVLDQIEAVVPT